MDDSADWLDRFIVSPAITNPGERAALYRATARGRFVRVVRGVYVPADYWESLNFEERHLARMRGIHLIYPGTVFSHLSAAIAWGIPVVGGDLSLPHSVVATASGGRSITGLRRYAVGVARDLHQVGGLTLTSPATTVLQIAAGFAPEVAVPALDAALRDARFGVTRDWLREAALTIPSSSGSSRCTWSIEFADPSSGSAGESVSRVGIHRLGLPRPILQQRFEDAFGLIGVVDFWWPEADVIGEFDGLGKYLREEFAAGRSPPEVVLDEKHRENRLRGIGPRVARWGWETARSRPALRQVLEGAGLRAR
jgi:hypothetical protein